MIQYLSRLKILDTLNVRNVPQFARPPTSLDIDFLFEAMGTRLAENLLRKRFNDGLESPSSLRTLGLGAATYGNARLGTYLYDDHIAASILRLRIFRIEYHQVQSRLSTSWVAKLHILAEGISADAEGYAPDLNLFHLYWLDGPVKKVRWSNT